MSNNGVEKKIKNVKKKKSTATEKPVEKKVKKKKRSSGGLETYTTEIGEEICDLLATSTMSLVELCRNYPHLPCERTIYRWRWKYPEFGLKFGVAKARQAEIMAEEVISIARDKAYIYDEHGNKKVDTGYVMSQRLQADVHRWIAAKLVPKLYGDVRQIDALTTQNAELQQQLEVLRKELNSKNKKEY